MDELLDPEFLYHESCTKLCLWIGRTLSDGMLLDFRVEDYANLMEQGYKDMVDNGVIAKLSSLGVETQFWQEEIMAFKASAEEWRGRISDNYPIKDPLLARIYNDQMMKLDRLFIMHQGTTFRLITNTRTCNFTDIKYSNFMRIYPDIFTE